jgi:hypothetical protein
MELVFVKIVIIMKDYKLGNLFNSFFNILKTGSLLAFLSRRITTHSFIFHHCEFRKQHANTLYFDGNKTC